MHPYKILKYFIFVSVEMLLNVVSGKLMLLTALNSENTVIINY
jgi:hypothetical protein